MTSLVRSREVGAYGWSYSYGKEQRVLSEEYKRNYDKIKWKGIQREPDSIIKCKRGVAKVWVFK